MFQTRRLPKKPKPHIDTLDCCPQCGDSEGYYTKVIEVVRYHASFDGVDLMGTHPEYVRGGQVVYCGRCHNPIARTDNPHVGRKPI